MAKHKTHYEDCDVLVVGGVWLELVLLLKLDTGEEI